MRHLEGSCSVARVLHRIFLCLAFSALESESFLSACHWSLKAQSSSSATPESLELRAGEAAISTHQAAIVLHYFSFTGCLEETRNKTSLEL